VPFPAVFGTDGNGSFAHPYSSLQQALDIIEHDHQQGLDLVHRTTIYLYPTHHFLVSIHLGKNHSHTHLTTMNITDNLAYERLLARESTHRRLSKAVLSDGMPVTGWIKINETTCSAKAPSSTFVNQLFIDNRRVPCTRVPMNYSEYLYYAAPINDSIVGRYGFQYQSG
jgi:hypothetical protein